MLCLMRLCNGKMIKIRRSAAARAHPAAATCSTAARSRGDAGLSWTPACEIARVEIDPITGRIAIVTKHGDEAEPGDAHNSWDDTVTSNAADPKRTA